MEKQIIFNHLSDLKKKELIAYIDAAWDIMTEKQQRSVFNRLYKELTTKPLNVAEHLAEVEIFYNESLQKKYYAPFHINSKNFMDVPVKTDIWFETISNFLDKTCELVKKGEKDSTLKSFKLLFELIRLMEDGKEIVFAKELGDWMITAKHDYQKVYKELQASL